MEIFDKSFGKAEESAKSGKLPEGKAKFLKKIKKGVATYEIYEVADAESAKRFLMLRTVDKTNYHLFVQTSEGNWGLDINGLYLERLLPFQLDVNSAKYKGEVGEINKMKDMFGFEHSFRSHILGITDNFVTHVICGKCKHEWLDGVRVSNVTVVRCPSCKTLNKIDLSHLSAQVGP